MKSNVLIVLFIISSFKALAALEKIQISSSKATVLTFDDVINELELGNNDYVSKIKGKFLLIRAKSLNARPTFLFVRYSNGNKFYNLEITPSDKAPLEYNITDKVNDSNETNDKNISSSKSIKDVKYLFNKQQHYHTYSKKEYGIRITLLDIVHYNGSTYFKFNINNNSSIDMCIDYVLFNYYDKSSSLPFFAKKINIKSVDPTFLPDSLTAHAFTNKDYIFGIPTISVNGGIDICFGESDEGRTITMSIPSRILLKAQKRK